MIHTTRFICFLLFLATLPAYAQKDPAWDDTRSRNWPVEALRVSIPSSVDGKAQNAYFYKAPGPERKPLIVSLHTWSGNYEQKDTLVHFCTRSGYHYIHPDFRGPNHNPEALGSDLVISDIDDAIAYALSNAPVDPENIHVIGVSGGGYATVLTYMKSKHNIRSFSAYVGIYNLIDWYHESLGRGNKYAGDIAAASSGDRNKLDIGEAKKRSPYFMDTPTGLRKNSRLNLYCGIHDGYTGSVPVSHTLRMYNKIVKDFQPDAMAALIPEEYINTMLSARSLPGMPDQGKFLGQKIIYQNRYSDLVSVTAFEGTHEMPPGNVLAHVPARTILAIGDSNGAMEGGWADQLKKLRPQDRIINTCVSGNTIGFDNLNREELNTLKNIGRYIGRAEGRLDAIILMLGTNDSKAEFDRRADEVPANLEKLIRKIKEEISKKPSLGSPSIYVVSPPPYGEDSTLAPKYHGGAARVGKLTGKFREAAAKTGVHYIDTHDILKAVFPYISPDGVHLSGEGQTIIASILNESLNFRD